MSDSLMGACSCGQMILAGGERCDACAAARYGGQERHEAMRLFSPAPAPIRGQLAMDARPPIGDGAGRGGLAVGERVRLLLPGWDSPGSVVYVVERIAGDRAVVREPAVPGLAGAAREYPLTQLVRA
jgi:hypothetical protein